MPDAKLSIKGLPDLTCFKSFADLLLALPNFLTVEIPDNITNVTVSNIQPLDTERDHVWFRFSNGGTFIGIYLFTDGSWKQFFPVPQSVYTVYGNSDFPPEGYITTEDSGSLTSDQKEFFKAQWHFTGSIFDVFTVVPEPI